MSKKIILIIVITLLIIGITSMCFWWNKEIENIVFDGVYVEDPNGTDVFYEFKNDGSIIIAGNVGHEEGTYKSVGKNQIEVILTKLVTLDEETDENIITEINRIIEIDLTDKNLLKCKTKYDEEIVEFELYKIDIELY